jgi:hypothetical protein
MQRKDGREIARDNEFKILRALHRFGWARTRDLAALIWTRWAAKAPDDRPSFQPPVATASALRMAQRTLARLRKSRQVLSTQAPDGSIIYTLSEGGARMLRNSGIVALTGKDLVRSFSSAQYRHRCIANEIAIASIIQGYRASTDREVATGLWLGGESGIAGKKPDVVIRSRKRVWWIEVQRSRMNAKDHKELLRFLNAVRHDVAQSAGPTLLGDQLFWGGVVFICTPAFQEKLCRDLVAAGWSKSDIGSLLVFEMSLY